MTLWTVNLFFRCHSSNSSAACLSFDVRICPTELPGIQQRDVWVVGGKRNFWLMIHISTHPLLSLNLSLSLFRLSLPVSLHPPSPLQKRKEKKQRHAWLAGGSADQKRCSQTPISLVSTRRGTVRIQNKDPRPKPSNAPLSAPCQLPVCYVKVPQAVNHATGFWGS